MGHVFLSVVYMATMNYSYLFLIELRTIEKCVNLQHFVTERDNVCVRAGRYVLRRCGHALGYARSAPEILGATPTSGVKFHAFLAFIAMGPGSDFLSDVHFEDLEFF